VTCVDQSKEALERAAANAERNHVADKMTFVRANCMHDLRARAEEGQAFGLVIVDPPAFAKSRREVQGAERGYVELNRRAFTLTSPGGMVVSASQLQRARRLPGLPRARRRARRPRCVARRDARRRRGSSRLLTLPESSYLKCAFVRV
jgi:23S rRNA (cytosine1962-C5)-methyltransferase